ncbi:aminoglycoside phosphotransferase [Streptosporangium album]|uniref:Aminoglycoside phosphotransferase n=1 Tax=Streptosporangium album TaxID=47479 RepID=A0A7W7RT75_9ACTN|nr:aminoglycoside phosphotransferase family protein [Streptosporangium album]MBB4937789.1 aminoglycoside phosphotransferase [Streptosporangium album]
MTSNAEAAARVVLGVASLRAGLDPDEAELIRLGENALFRLRGGIIARVTRPGQIVAAAREVAVARWLETSDVSAVQVWPDVDQPVEVDGRAVTWWRELPPHKNGTALQVATALRRLHDLPPPLFAVGRLDPFVRLSDRIERAMLPEADRRWMRRHLGELEARYAELPAGLPECVVHGDAWVGNVVSTDDDVVLLDLERCSVGPPEWDLTSTAVKAFTLAGITAADYEVFVRAYGHDVTAWAGFEVLRDIREFRMTCMAAQVAAENPARHDEIVLRLACLRGERGSRPWLWTPVP